VDAWKKKIQNKWPALRVETWKDKNSALFLALRLEKMTIGIFLGLAALIAVFSMVSALSLLVSQKRSEIGLMQALGLSGRRIQQLFLKLGVFISGFGILIGAGVGSALAMLLEKYPLHLLPDYYVDSEIPALLNTGFVLVYIVLGLGISVAAAWVPAKSVLDVTPVKALRQKV
jgi:lipoprotein-releasing system permease protein